MTKTDDYDLLHCSAGHFVRSMRGTVGISGNDRASFLQGLLTNDIEALSSGRGCYATYLTPQGRLITDMNVLDTGNSILLDVDIGITHHLVERFNKLIFSEDVQISDLSNTWTQIGVRGPRAATVLATVLAETDLDAVSLHASEFLECDDLQTVQLSYLDEQVLISRNDDVGVVGFDVRAPTTLDTALRERLAATGAVSVDERVLEILRVEAGRPLFPVDLDERTIPLEAGIEDRAISLTKGCYVGQEVIIRILHRGQGKVARKLVGLTVMEAASTVPIRNAKLFDNEKEVGHITSAVQSPALGCPIALGYVHRDYAAPGMQVQIQDQSHGQTGTVTKLPFITP
ncbi:uncharacterized protein METZ01_LOCUS9141 [marine metagenome]|jgi:folate-binding protein YgfZ|uniref:Aminomethyltransferase folate-binding domain-containing protein n=1 Tax=marine metagenome TaxID=408172 RepID=A0A381NP39_9ZZZZ|nr:hypothetical protein [Acidobacteriota bacterium]|tara:strand:- start:511 stop:1542 length:1032 start_codon:yes stop_codon:yes gene_type:complete